MSNFNISLPVCRGNLFHDDSESEKRHCRGTPGIPASWMAPAKSKEASAGKLPCLSLKDWFCLDAVCPGCYRKQCKKDGVGGDMSPARAPYIRAAQCCPWTAYGFMPLWRHLKTGRMFLHHRSCIHYYLRRVCTHTGVVIP